MSDPKYQRHTAIYHIGLAVACLIAVAWSMWYSGISPVVSLILTAVTNALIAWEKQDLLKRGKS
jgi:CHASE2 domain-containing sensor protein